MGQGEEGKGEGGGEREGEGDGEETTLFRLQLTPRKDFTSKISLGVKNPSS